MKFLSRSLSKAQPHHHGGSGKSLADATAGGIKCVRDRGLDHAVAREKNLMPLLNIKNLIKSEPSKSLPISIITQQKQFLKIPARPIEFIRNYPSIFQEFLPGGIGIHPHIKLTPEVLNLDAEEQLVYQSESYKQELSDRLLKLLMISRLNKIPLKTLDMLKWELGLPQDFVKSIVPEFPDYFRVCNVKGPADNGELELVCWSNELAVSVLEKKAGINRVSEYSKGMPIAFPMKFSQGFEMDKDVKKWVNAWQKLPYISPYENESHLSPSSDESDKWTAAVLHEILNLFVSKKAEKENLLCFGEFLGIRSRFKRALLHHPGIFYVSGKIGTYTVVLRDAYKRGMLIESNPLMRIRSQYIKLMNKSKEEHKTVSAPGGSKQEGRVKDQGKVSHGDNEDDGDEKEEAGSLSDSEIEDENEIDGGKDGRNRNPKRHIGRSAAVGSERASRRKNSDPKERKRNLEGETRSKNSHEKSSREGKAYTRSKVRLLTEKRSRI